MKTLAVRTASLAGLLAMGSVACQAAPPAKAASASAEAAASDSAAVLARGTGVAITAAELDKRVAGRLAPLRQQEYDIRKDALDEMVAEALEAKEAKTRGLSPDALIQKEVADKVKDPTKEAVDLVYEQFKSRLQGQSREQAGPQIEKFLKERDVQVRRQAFRRELLDKAQVKIALEPPRTEVPVPAGAPALGPANAPVTMVAFTDYQCPYCHRAQNTVDQLLTKYAGKVRLVHRDFPLDGHPQALPAARAAWCAGDQGKFWEYYKSLMTVPGDMSEQDLATRAAGLNLDPASFKTCAVSDKHDATIKDGQEAGARLGVSGTPAYFINGRLLTGAQPLEEFQKVIDAELGAS